MIDELDARLIELLAAEPRVGVLEASRRLGVARGTVQARLDRLQARGVVTGYGPDIDPAALDHAVTAFVTLEIRQAGGHDPVAERLAAIPEVLEAHTITGARRRGGRGPGVDGDRARHAGALPGAAPGAHGRPAHTRIASVACDRDGWPNHDERSAGAGRRRRAVRPGCRPEPVSR